MAPPRISVADGPVGLRERRRRETLREVSDAALDLFEKQGVHATTVDEIAHAAAISPRTFFRYSPTKEHAIFAGDDLFASVMPDTVAAIRGGESLVAALEESWLRLFRDFDARPEDEHVRFLRVRRLVHTQPSLLAVLLGNDAERADRLTEAAVDAAGADADVLHARAVVAVMNAMTRLAFDEWARRSEEGAEARVLDIYLEVRRGFEAYADLLGRDPR